MSRKIVFMGTPEFAVRSLDVLYSQGIQIAAVITVPDKPAGRGQQVSESAVKRYALEKGLHLMQPVNLKDPDFINNLRKLEADLFVVVAFRMLPEIVWGMPPLGTINLHASLLPQYRGAAPINRAVMNGDSETGATTFFIEREIDTGKIIDQVKLPIGENETAGSVHDRLMEQGAQLLLKTVESIFNGDAKGIDQQEVMPEKLFAAPKIFREDCRIDWQNSATFNHNLVRGLSPYPAAWTELSFGGQTKTLKLFSTLKEIDGKDHSGILDVQGSMLRIGCSDGWLTVESLQLEGKKRMGTAEFLNGFNLSDWKIKN